MGAKKYPVRLANMIGTSDEKPVRADSRIVVLMGVLVTQELMAAIQLTMLMDKSTVGKKLCKIRPLRSSSELVAHDYYDFCTLSLKL